MERMVAGRQAGTRAVVTQPASFQFVLVFFLLVDNTSPSMYFYGDSFDSC